MTGRDPGADVRDRGALLAEEPLVRLLSSGLRREVARQAGWHCFDDGAEVFSEGQDCFGLPLVMRGAIRVSKRSPGGREVVLYRVGPGETCILTSSCLLGGSAYSAAGVAEGAVQLALLPPAMFMRLVAESPEARAWLFATLSGRLSGLMEQVGSLAFQRVDQRIAAFLVERMEEGADRVAMTHQRIADEIGSVREMVTRALGQMAEHGLVELSRAGVRLVDGAGLRDMALGERAGDKSR